MDWHSAKPYVVWFVCRETHDDQHSICSSLNERLLPVRGFFILVLGRHVLVDIRLMLRGVMEGWSHHIIHHSCHLS